MFFFQFVGGRMGECLSFKCGEFVCVCECVHSDCHSSVMWLYVVVFHSKNVECYVVLEWELD